MKAAIKINRRIRHVGKEDLILDNGECIQVLTQKGAFDGYYYAPLIMSKTLFKQLKKFDFIYLDVSKTKEKSKDYNPPRLFYFRFDIDKMIKHGYQEVEET